MLKVRRSLMLAKELIYNCSLANCRATFLINCLIEIEKSHLAINIKFEIFPNWQRFFVSPQPGQMHHMSSTEFSIQKTHPSNWPSGQKTKFSQIVSNNTKLFCIVELDVADRYVIMSFSQFLIGQ